jgi:hypothetical protein
MGPAFSTAAALRKPNLNRFRIPATVTIPSTVSIISAMLENDIKK